jgi:hypothetical protein
MAENQTAWPVSQVIHQARNAFFPLTSAGINIFLNIFSGVYGVELDPTDLRKFIGPPKHFFRFETTHIWERYGNWNEYGGFSWIEGPWMTKWNGTYYLKYAAPGN